MTSDETQRGEKLTLEDLLKLPGLDQMQCMIDGRIDGPNIARVLNFYLAEVGEGMARYEGRPKEEFLNPLGIVHGGWTATLLDSAMACAVHATLAPGETYTTLEYKVNCVRPIQPDGRLMLCTGNVIHRGRRSATSEGRLVDEEGKLYAHGVETCLIM
ncbi:MAG: PaaI family thioesterase [Pseudomonadota bacterium]